MVAVAISMPFRATRPTSRSPFGSSDTCPAFFGCPYASRPAATAPSDSSTRNGEYTAAVPSGIRTGSCQADSQ